MKRFLLLWCGLLLCASIHARGLQFAESMSGYAYVDGEYRNATVSLTVRIADIDAWSRNLNTPATVSGTLMVDRLPVQPITGTLTILAPAPLYDGRLLTYRLSSATLQYVGIKHVRDQAGPEVVDAMTTLRGVLLPVGQPLPTVHELLPGSMWSSELHFAWWDPVVVANFVSTFSSIDTPWYQELEVRGIFVKTVFGALAGTLFPWL